MPGTCVDETGNVYGKLRVVRKLTKNEKSNLGYGKAAYWLCECECGNKIAVRGDLLRSKIRSCGCDRGIDETGKVYGEWTVIRKSRPDEVEGLARGYGYWLCRCSCGKFSHVHGCKLRDGKSKSCGHTMIIDETGKRYGRLTVISKYIKEDSVEKEMMAAAVNWICKCDCGRTVIVDGHSLRIGKRTSCGCGAGKTRARDIVRTDKQKELLDDDDNKLLAVLLGYEVEHGIKMSSAKLMQLLGCSSTSAALNLVRNRGLDDLVAVRENISYIEAELIEGLGLKNGSTCLCRDRTVLDGKEIDIYIPSIKFGIEVNGGYFHSNKFKDNKYHINKTMLANKKGVQLLHIFDYEWKDTRKQQILYNMVYDKIYGGSSKVYARQCRIEKISNEVAKVFNEKYHLQGHVNASVTYGLVDYNGEILSIMSFGASRYGEYDYELFRYTARYDKHVIGGAEKLFKAACKEIKGSIVSYCDLSKFKGDVYERLGFTFDGYTEPNYVWYHIYKADIKSRYQCQKHRLVEAGLGTESESESEIMERMQYVKVFDCGNARYVINNR